MTFFGSKKNMTWVMICMNRATKQVVDFAVGARTKQNLLKIVNRALSFKPMAICTDGLITYKSLVPQSIHKVGLLYTRHIERQNLTLRMHQKRLGRKTICFSKSVVMLEHSLKIYYWS